MARRFLQPELARLPKPRLIEEISADRLIQEIKSDVLARWDEVRTERPDLPALDTLGLETEPLTVLIEAFAYRETLLRALVNDKARAVLLAFAVGSDLDHIGALVGVERAVVAPATNDTPVIMETDDRLRRRIQLAPEAFSVAGPAGAYEFHALSIDPSILDVYAYSPREGEVHVIVVGENVEPVSEDTMTKLIRTFKLGDVAPLTDSVTVRRARVVLFDLAVEASVTSGADTVAVRSSMENAIRAYLATRARIGAPVYMAGVIASAKTADIENIVITQPAGNVLCEPDQIAKLGTLTVSVTVIG
jgi:phage-related baseplate assembly protein